MKRAFILPPDWMLFRRSVIPNIKICYYLFMPLVEERNYESKVSCQETQPGPGQGSRQHINDYATTPPNRSKIRC